MERKATGKKIIKPILTAFLTLAMVATVVPSGMNFGFNDKNNSKVSRVEAAGAPTVNVPKEPTWSKVVQTGSEIENTYDLQEFIEEKVKENTPTEVQLTSDISRNGSVYGGYHLINLPNNTIIKITSTPGNNFKIDGENTDTSHGIISAGDNITLYLENITITGGNRTNYSGAGGGILLGKETTATPNTVTMVMKEGTHIIDNQANFGGGVYVGPNCNFYMLGGDILNNSSLDKVTDKGGGVYAYGGGHFYMTGGDISNNTAGFGGGIGADESPIVIDGDVNIDNNSGDGGGIYLNNNSKLDFANGKITANAAGNAPGRGYTGGGVYVQDSVFNMTGGQINKNTGFYGAAVNISGSVMYEGFDKADCSVFNMYGGIIGGESKDDANNGSFSAVRTGTDNWRYQGGTFNMYGGQIKNNTGDYGGLSVNDFGVANLYNDSEISNNDGFEGGGILLHYGRASINDNVQIIDNTATIGGGISVDCGELTVNGGKISGNTASNGGGIWTDNLENQNYPTSGVITLNGGEISNNTANKGGGIMDAGTATTETITMILNGGSIKDNTANNNGGGIYLQDTGSRLVLNKGEITGNTAINGGGIYDSRPDNDYSNITLPSDGTVDFKDNKSSKTSVAYELPTVSTWSGKINTTSIEGMEFYGKIKDKIDTYLNANQTDDNALNRLIVFNNDDINYQSDILTYKVDFETNGGSYVNSQLFPSDEAPFKAVKPESNPTKDKFDFENWYGDNELKSAFDFETELTDDTTLYANWTPAPIIDNPNKGDEDKDEISKDDNSTKNEVVKGGNSKTVEKTTVTTKTVEVKNTNKEKSAETGDMANILGLLFLLFSAVTISGVLIKRKL
ncbi:MAG: InlB B-repeat-containing protein [Lachnospiraceae bacterium]|jgi:uncharacterized repeat protein (TIGR02543 family)|nr:InlB B-repeat-containing protein [Lachnospiraceae bacterium]